MSSSSLSNASLSNASGRLRRIWLVGCGSMGGTLLSRWLGCGPPAGQGTGIDPSPGGLPPGFAGTVAASVADAVASTPDPTLVVLAIKPQLLARIAAELQPALSSAPLLLSMLAGVRVESIRGFFPGAPVIRIMPNTPARIGRGVTALYQGEATAADVESTEALLATVGSIERLDDESRFDAVTAVSGSGPAFLFRFIEAMAAAAESVGLDAETARRLSLETIAGAAELARQSELSPAKLRQQVTSPNGTTEAGLDVLDGEGVLSSLLRSTVRAAAERSRELAVAADSGSQAARA